MGEYKNLRFALNDKCIYLHPNNGQTLRPYNVCFTSTSSYVSITSPTFKSLQFVKLIPHSKLVPTSFTSSLKRFKDDVKEVGTNFECGISLTNCNDLKVGDVIETYEEVEVKQTL